MRVGLDVGGTKIAAGVAHIPSETAEAKPATAHMFIINPLTGGGMDNLFSTHPDTGNRIAALMEQAQSMGIGRSAAAPSFAGQAGGSPGGSQPRQPGPWG